MIKPRDVQVAEIGTNTLVLRSRTWDRLKFEVEYARQKGTTANSYLIQGQQTALIDPPGESFTDLFLAELENQVYLQRLDYIILSHVNPNRITTLKRLLDAAPYAKIICSKPAANTLRLILSSQSFTLPTPREEEAQDLGIDYGQNQTLAVHIIRDEETLDLSHGHLLQFRFVPTPRHPDAIATFDPTTGILFTDKLFAAHLCEDALFDEAWKPLADDRRFYFDCLHATQALQVEAALDKFAPLTTKMYAPGHGPIVRHSVSVLTLDYRHWCQQQQTQELKALLLYTSAYGNTATLGTAIAKGLTQAGVAVQTLNCEFASPEDIIEAVQTCDGFMIGTPTLAGHPPTQIQTALGLVLSHGNPTKVAGVFGSYGWSGEAVDLVEGKLQDAGYQFGFPTIRVKFKPTAEILNDCEQAGAEFARALNRARKVRAPRQSGVDAQSDRTTQAVGRVTGSLCVVTLKTGHDHYGFLTASVSQAGFTPPAITLAVAKNRPEGGLEIGEPFVLNILKEGKNLRRPFLKPVAAGENPFETLATSPANNGCWVLTDAIAYLECTIHHRVDCGDSWLLYAVVDTGKLLASNGVTAVNHRKSAVGV
jgi:flavorubredoxin/flavin reductase (DIM6/NTAB) family NADH-FMN oxidoreductase RutF